MSKYIKTFNYLKSAREWAYSELDTSNGQRHYLMEYETLQGYTEFFFMPIDGGKWEMHETVSIIEVWE